MDTTKVADKNKGSVSNVQTEAIPTADGITNDTNLNVQQEENACAKEAKVDVNSHPIGEGSQHNQNKSSVRAESIVQTEIIPTTYGTTDTKVNVQQEEHTVPKNAKVAVDSHPLEVEQHNQVVKVDSSFKNTLQNLFSMKVATGGLMTYGILREGIMRADEKVLKDYTAPCLTYKKRMFLSSGYQHEHSFKSLDGEDITSYAVIAQDVDNELITADVVDGGIGLKHIKFQVTSHKEGPWKYRVVICGKEA